MILFGIRDLESFLISNVLEEVLCFCEILVASQHKLNVCYDVIKLLTQFNLCT